MRGRERVLGWCCFLALAGGPARGEECRLIMPRPGNAFYTGEPLRFAVVVDGPRQRLRYTMDDREARTLRTGSVGVGLGQRVEFAPGQLPNGFYHLRLELAESVVEDTFCVIPPPWEDAGDYSLFGLHPDDWTPESLQAAAQMGARNVRYNILWPNSEPNRDQWDGEYIRRGYDLAQRSGQQMLVVLGYTPGWQAQRAENANSFVEPRHFTWHPREPDKYAEYFGKVSEFARGKTVQWPPPAIVPPGWSPPTETRPWVGAWEVWNEVDLCFYFGDWNRYCDLLHLTFARSRALMPDTPVVYGGSTGGFSAMAMLMAGSLRYCYDYGAFHPDEFMEDELSLWYSGAYQIPYCAGLPRETVHTEAYCVSRKLEGPIESYQETPEDLLRLYVSLKAWREVAYYRSGCTGGWIYGADRPCQGLAMLVRRAGGLSPTPLYPAFAAARHLLSDATVVGPVGLGEGVTAYAFLKHGKTMLAAWSDRGAEVTFHLAPGAYRVDAMGRRLPLGERARWRKTVGPEPVVIVGAQDSLYLGQALRQRYMLFSGTYYGVPPWPQCGRWYVARLNEDLGDWADPDAPRRVLWAVRAAARALATDPDGGLTEIATAQQACAEAMTQIVAAAGDEATSQPRAMSTAWRLARVAEWLGEVADARSFRAGDNSITGPEIVRLRRRLDRAQGDLRQARGGANAPFAEHFLTRARRLLGGGGFGTPGAVSGIGRGVGAAAEHEIALAEQLGLTEPGVALQVVPLLDFPTGRLMRKAWLLEPGREHTLRAWVYNYLSREITGSLTIGTPEMWEPKTIAVPFTARANGPSAPVDVTVSLPADPRPWRQTSSFTLDGPLSVELPPSLLDRPEIWVKGQLADGTVIPDMAYFVNVGRPLDLATTSATLGDTSRGRALLSPKALTPRRASLSPSGSGEPSHGIAAAIPGF